MATVIPAVDIRGGRCVRLRQGRPDEETIYFERPADAAKCWADQGAELIHVVDLDGAFEGRPINADAVAEIVAAVDVPVEIGGGIRTDATVARYLEMGIERVVLGTRALHEPEWMAGLCTRFPNRIVGGIDARDGKVTVEGWAETSEIDALEFARQVDPAGLRAVIFTDVATDGTLSGPNLPALRRVNDATTTPVIASGGIATLEHVRQVAELGVEGMIIGKALFAGALSLSEAIDAARSTAG